MYIVALRSACIILYAHRHTLKTVSLASTINYTLVTYRIELVSTNCFPYMTLTYFYFQATGQNLSLGNVTFGLRKHPETMSSVDLISFMSVCVSKAYPFFCPGGGV